MSDLARICRGYGTVEVYYTKEDDPFCWTVRLVRDHDGTATFNHTHGELLDKAIEDLYLQLQADGVVTMTEAWGHATP